MSIRAMTVDEHARRTIGQRLQRVQEEITVTIGDHLKRVHGVEFNDALRRKAMDRILLDPA